MPSSKDPHAVMNSPWRCYAQAGCGPKGEPQNWLKAAAPRSVVDTENLERAEEMLAQRALC